MISKRYFEIFRFWSIILFLALFAFSSCKNNTETDDSVWHSRPLPGLISIPKASKLQKEKFNAEALADSFILGMNGNRHIMYECCNREFLDEIIMPAILPYTPKLRELSYAEIVNEVTIFTFQIYQHYFGSSFYRWAGDIFDLDDAQPTGIEIKRRYGLDCSGFSSAPYEIAVYAGLIPDSIALFSTQGFKIYCQMTGFRDEGALDGGGNRFRLDTRELDLLGDELFRIAKNGTPSDKEIALLQPGDIVGRNGHFGIIAFLNGEAYYFESGGWVVPVNGGNPVKAKAAMKKFAQNGYLTIRRCLN
ncbi:MAG TPA: hypothetical protein ENN84_01920 [Candidatus Marinimicrobia bacterium]|nr:hypothetical protein [Candidatus Neomarinimicrobiota bacterium]